MRPGESDWPSREVSKCCTSVLVLFSFITSEQEIMWNQGAILSSGVPGLHGVQTWMGCFQFPALPDKFLSLVFSQDFV